MAENPHKHTRGHTSFIPYLVEWYPSSACTGSITGSDSLTPSSSPEEKSSGSILVCDTVGILSITVCPVWKQIRRELKPKTLWEHYSLPGMLAKEPGQAYPSSTSLRSQPNSNWFSFSPQGWKEAEERISWIYFPVGTESTGKHVCRKLPANKSSTLLHINGTLRTSNTAHLSLYQRFAVLQLL